MKNRYSKILPILIAFVLLAIGWTTPAMAAGYDKNNPAPPNQFTSPASGQTVIVGPNNKCEIIFTVPTDSNIYSYCSQFEVDYYVMKQWLCYCYMSPVYGTSTYSMGQFNINYPSGTTVQFRVRTISNVGATSSWVYSGYLKSNTPISAPPALSISPNPTAVNNCYENTIQLSWQPCMDPDGQTITYQVELGTWNGTQYGYLPVAKTTSTTLQYDISKSCVYNNTTIPAINRGQQFAFRIKASDGIDDTSYSVLSGLHRNSAPNSVASVQAQASGVYEGMPAQVNFAQAQDTDGNIAGYEAALKDSSGNWYNNGEIVGLVNSSDATSLMINPGPWSMSAGQWTCYIRAYDSYGVRGSWSGSGAAISYLDYLETGLLNSSNDLFSIYGAVQPSIVSAEVTLNTCFVIDPNAVDIHSRFISPKLSIRNLSSMPVEISILSCKATGGAPKIVAPETYSPDEWLKLGLADSMKYIALGLKGSKSGFYWFDNEAFQEEYSLGIFAAGESTNYTLQAQFGLAWKEPENFKYDLVFELRLVQ